MKPTRKTIIANLTKLTFTVAPSGSRADVKAEGQTSSSGWTEPELGNERVGDGITHLDFLAVAPGASADVMTPISTTRTFILTGEPRDITVHSQTNELSITLPQIGDPA
jgi:hypothetical protein